MDRFRSLFSTSRDSQYQKTHQMSSDDEALLSKREIVDEEDDRKVAGRSDSIIKPQSESPWIKYTIFGILFVLYTFGVAQLSGRNISDAKCGKQTTVYSPIEDAIEYIEYDFDTAFDRKSKYRGPPTPELEKAWNDLWRFDPVPFPEQKLAQVNRSGGMVGHELLARLNDGKGDVTSDGRGPVLANFEVFHQIHCLNYLRQYTWRDWYFEHPEKVVIPQDMLASDVGVRIHADHCIDFLRETLMCHSDTTPSFTVIDPSQPMGARGDFNAHHKCRDFKKLQEWNREHGVHFGSFNPHAQSKGKYNHMSGPESG